jgi:hypothetical protein
LDDKKKRRKQTLKVKWYAQQEITFWTAKLSFLFVQDEKNFVFQKPNS